MHRGLCSRPGLPCSHLCPQLCLLSLRILQLPSAAVPSMMLGVLGALSCSTHPGSFVFPASPPAPCCPSQKYSVWVVRRVEEGLFENVNKSMFCRWDFSTRGISRAGCGAQVSIGVKEREARSAPGLWV